MPRTEHRWTSIPRQPKDHHYQTAVTTNLNRVATTRQPTTVTVDIDLTRSASIPKPKRLEPRAGCSNGGDLEVIVLSDDEDFETGFLPNNGLPGLRSSPTIVASSPIPMQGKKRCWTDVIELSSDEDRQVKKARKSF
jgi:hypothetical protein